MGQPWYAYDFFHFSLTLCFQYGNRIWRHCHDLITTSEEPACIHHHKNSQTSIQWRSIKYNNALKFHPNIKVHVNYRHLYCFIVLTFAIRGFWLISGVLTFTILRNPAKKYSWGCFTCVFLFSTLMIWWSVIMLKF